MNIYGNIAAKAISMRSHCDETLQRENWNRTEVPLTQNDTFKDFCVSNKKHFLIYFKYILPCTIEQKLIKWHLWPYRKSCILTKLYLELYLFWIRKSIPDCWSTFNIWSTIPLFKILGDISMKEKIEMAETLEAGKLEIWNAPTLGYHISSFIWS